ncbi:uncharacterized protein LOC131146883 isoform X2 [Malania oleifera]|uniref:uncharacterized protein LOC131146883 isoform X2 n=1 Tax=Malania oleifera TaxID=397392 RepID=UPI0025ADEBDA|nr:uncharacterized protein LOC131146883 isoform X2 [Malania oleifera]
MRMQASYPNFNHHCSMCLVSSSSITTTTISLLRNKHIKERNIVYAESYQIAVLFSPKINERIGTRRRRGREGGGGVGIVVASSNAEAAPLWDGWKPEKTSTVPSLSDVLWPSAAMAILGRIDTMLAPRGISLTIPPVGAVSAALFATPSAPAARADLQGATQLQWSLSIRLDKKYNMFMAQIGCAAIGVVAFSLFGPGWLARSTALAASIAFMIYTRATHPPAASLPLLFIDGARLHHLNFWYALFPGATGCILLCLIQEMVCYLRDNFKF